MYRHKAITVNNVNNYYTYTNQNNYEVFSYEHLIWVCIGTFDNIGRHYRSTIGMNIHIRQTPGKIFVFLETGEQHI